MSLSSLLLGAFLIVLGANWLTWIAVSVKFLGLFAVVTGIVILVEQYRPIKL